MIGIRFSAAKICKWTLRCSGTWHREFYVTLYLLDEHDGPALPLRFQAKEGQKHTHRIVVYRPQDLLLNNRLDFVGFVSSKQKPWNAQVDAEIRTADKQLDAELKRTPGLLSYSSLELRDGRWCNLVLFNAPEAKTHIKHSATHAHAAYEIAPRYYDWVHIHTGIMPGGLIRNELIVQKTRHYLFHGVHEKPTIREVRYDEDRHHLDVCQRELDNASFC